MTNRPSRIAAAVSDARDADLLDQRRDHVDAGESIDPEDDGRLGWHLGVEPSDSGYYEAGLPVAEQSEAYQEYRRGYTLEVEHNRRSVRMAVAAEINELVQEYGRLVAGLPVAQITDAEALSIGLAKGVLTKIIEGWGKP